MCLFALAAKGAYFERLRGWSGMRKMKYTWAFTHSQKSELESLLSGFGLHIGLDQYILIWVLGLCLLFLTELLFFKSQNYIYGV